MKSLEISIYPCQEIYVGVTHFRTTTKITSLKHLMFMTEREDTPCFRTYRNAYYTGEVELTEECLQQDMVSFMFVEKTFLNVTLRLLSTSTTKNNQHSPSFIKADPK